MCNEQWKINAISIRKSTDKITMSARNFFDPVTSSRVSVIGQLDRTLVLTLLLHILQVRLLRFAFGLVVRKGRILICNVGLGPGSPSLHAVCWRIGFW